MNTTLVQAFLRQRLSSPFRLVLLLAQFVIAWGSITIFRDLSPAASAGLWFAFTIAAGSIGQDVSAGTLQLLLARPVTRAEYVVSRWLAASIAGAGLATLLLLVASMSLMLRGVPPQPIELVGMLLQNVAGASGVTAVLICFSSLVGGLGDLAIWFGVQMTALIVSAIADRRDWRVVGQVVTEITSTLKPEVGFGWLVHHGPAPWLELATWSSTIAIALTCAILRVNRRELSYAAD